VVDEKPKENDVIVEVPFLSPIHTEKAPESPINVFSPPSTPFSPPPNRQRPETPREILDSPGLIINHNLHHPPTPQSPFYPSPHSRIRTESLCSIKSATVANLQPRKKVRTEDQKILDNKRESRERLSNKKIEKSQLRMFDMIYYNPTTNPMKPRATPSAKDKPSPKKIDLTMELPPPTPPPQEASNAIAVPQLKLNADGELVLDEASLVVENEEQKKNRILLANTNVVYHDELSGTYGYYKRQQRTKEWPQEETIKFYRCLNTVGTDFSLMLNLFPNRSRRDLKLKFKKEEKNNPNLVDKALLNHNTFDIEELQRELDEEDEIRRREAESKSSEVKELVKRKILKKQEAKAKARQNDKAKIEKILSDGDLVLNSVDNQVQDVKENMVKSEAAGKRKRAPKKKNIKNEPSMEFKKIMLHAKINESISHSPSMTSMESYNLSIKTVEPSFDCPIISIEPPLCPSALSAQESSDPTMSAEFINNSVICMEPEPKRICIEDTKPMSATSFDWTSISVEPSYSPSTLSVQESSDQIVSAEFTNHSVICMQPEPERMCIEDTKSMSAASFDWSMDIESSAMSIQESNGQTVSVEFTNNSVIAMESSHVKHEIAAHPSILYAEPSYPSISGEPSYSPSISYEPSILSVKPSYSPSMISMEPSFNPSIISAEPSYDWPTISVEPSYSPSTLSVQESNDPTVSAEFTTNSVICMEPEPERICIEDTEPERICVEDTEPERICVEDTEPERICIEDTEPERICVEDTEPTAEKEEEPLDDESFLNSLDLERLVIVVKQINGKDFYDIHETDGDMQNLSDKPLNLPRHIVDLIVDAMTQDD